jgi:hypothetical protein
MSDYPVFTIDVPSTDPAVNRRLGYRTPRSILLPPYLLFDQYWIDYTDSLDAVLGPAVDEKIDILANIRNMWVTNPDLENNQIANGQLVAFDQWSQPEREILVKQVNLLGMKLQNAGVLSNDAYHTVARFVGQYWFQKGTQSFIDFINFCLSSTLTVQKLWTEDYTHFVPEGSATIGSPIWEGGTWYPTTHVSIVAKGGLSTLDIQTLVSFFYEIANYNLVLQAVDISYDMYITDDETLTRTDSEVVAIGLWADSAITLSNTLRLGADPPGVYDVAPMLPSNALTTTPNATDYTTQYILAAPSAWIEDADGDKIPVYTTLDQQVSEAPSLPTTLMGGQSTLGAGNLSPAGFTMLLGPTTWIKVPGSSRSQARIPVFSSVPVPRIARQNATPSRMIGNLRGNILVNPKGFKEFVTGSGQFYPYW